jgi:hypothetical protein
MNLKQHSALRAGLLSIAAALTWPLGAGAQQITSAQANPKED